MGHMIVDRFKMEILTRNGMLGCHSVSSWFKKQPIWSTFHITALLPLPAPETFIISSLNPYTATMGRKWVNDSFKKNPSGQLPGISGIKRPRKE